ncbi:MAG: hypothetical protein ACI3XN_06980 [Eubacteriales bacterium]
MSFETAGALRTEKGPESHCGACLHALPHLLRLGLTVRRPERRRKWNIGIHKPKMQTEPVHM